jgi:general secretion pathway protein N
MKWLSIWPAWLACVLALAVALEIAAPAPDLTINAPAPAGVAVATAPPALAAIDAGTWQASILARPLFRPDRRPLSAAPEPSEAMKRLTAIVMTASGSAAIFAGDDGKPIIVTVGGEVNGLKIVAIGPDNVVLTGPSGRLVLQPKFANASDAANAGNAGIITLPPRLLLDNQ